MTMKRNIIKKLGLLCITGMVMGCTADYDKLNTDPTGLTAESSTKCEFTLSFC